MSCALGPVLFGRVFDASGSYVVLLMLGAATTLVSGLLMLAMRLYKLVDSNY